MKKSILAFAAAMFLSGSIATAQELGHDDPAKIIQTCQGCHDNDNHDGGAVVPRLNGQSAGYIFARLKDVSRKSIAHVDSTRRVVAVLDDKMMLSIAYYFAKQPPALLMPGSDGPRGKRIYENGITAHAIIPCKDCHGTAGEGHDATPRLAGQHAAYLKKQLLVFSSQSRESGLMHGNTEFMTRDDREALVSYLAND